METRKIMYNTDLSERTQQLLAKPVTELCQMIISLQEENEKLKEYRTRLIKIRNLVVPDEEKRKQGRPSKSEGDII
jgi:hypothetical protein